MQSRRHSLVESITNVAIGYVIAVASQVIVFPLVGVDSTLSQNMTIGVYFTFISLARSYVIRRWFNSGLEV